MPAQPSVGDAPELVDLRGLTCPLPVLHTAKRLRRLARGKRILVLTSDPLATLDIPAFCTEVGHLLVTTEEADGGHRFLIEKGAPQAR